MGCFGIAACLLVVFLIMALFAEYPIPALIISVILVGLGVYYYQVHKEELDEEKKRKEEIKEKAMKAYMDAYSWVVIPENAPKVRYKDGFPDLLKTDNYVWVEKDNLCFFPAKPPPDDSPHFVKQIIQHKIPLDKIEYYTIKGELVHETKISGGGGGGSSLGGAVVGGIVAGGAGAIIGSRKETDPIQSELITHDKRETILIYLDHINIERTMSFGHEGYDVLYKLIPGKSYHIVDAIRTNKIIQEQSNSKSIANQIRELAKLKDSGMLTDEEFSEKKKALLDKM